MYLHPGKPKIFYIFLSIYMDWGPQLWVVLSNMRNCPQELPRGFGRSMRSLGGNSKVSLVRQKTKACSNKNVWLKSSTCFVPQILQWTVLFLSNTAVFYIYDSLGEMSQEFHFASGILQIKNKINPSNPTKKEERAWAHWHGDMAMQESQLRLWHKYCFSVFQHISLHWNFFLIIYSH